MLIPHALPGRHVLETIFIKVCAKKGINEIVSLFKNVIQDGGSDRMTLAKASMSGQ